MAFTISKIKLDQINTQQALSSSPLIFKLQLVNANATSSTTCADCMVSIKDSTFQSINGGPGSIVQVNLVYDAKSVLIENSVFFNITSTGGLFGLVNAKNAIVQVVNCTLNKTTTSGSGGLVGTVSDF
jgi:hypothetical protein